MQIFELNEQNLKQAWGASCERWFSLKDYTISDVIDLIDYDAGEEESTDEYLINKGYIPYFAVSNEEVMYSFIQTLQNKKLKAVFDKVSADDYTETFWKYYKLYPEMSEGFHEFENKYLMDKAVKWCESNNINYKKVD